VTDATRTAIFAASFVNSDHFADDTIRAVVPAASVIERESDLHRTDRPDLPVPADSLNQR
jgi:hypothetical protein